MLVFIDESGDVGLKFDHGSSLFFVITAVIFKDNFAADACDREIDQLRRSLGLKPGFEFHFTHCRDTIRTKFLAHVSTQPFRYHAFVLDKRKLFGERFRDPKSFYTFAADIVCDNARQLLTDAKITIDKHGDRAFKQQLSKALKQRMTEPDGTCLIRRVGMEQSHSNNLSAARRHGLRCCGPPIQRYRPACWRFSASNREKARAGCPVAKMKTRRPILSERRP